MPPASDPIDLAAGLVEGGKRLASSTGRAKQGGTPYEQDGERQPSWAGN